MSAIESIQLRPVPDAVATAPARSQFWPLLILLIAATAAFAPVLLRPHWGLFSDAGQILEDCRLFWDAHGLRIDILTEQYRPGFNIFDKIVWLFSADQPFGFYFTRWLFFLVAISFTYLNCFTFSRSRLISFVLSCFWFTGSPTYEVIYTLDKAEMYISVLFSVSLFTFFGIADRLTVGALPEKVLKNAGALIAFCFAYAIFTKQTGALVLVMSALFALETFAFKKWIPHALPEWMQNIDVDALERQCAWARSIFRKAVWSYCAFQIFFFIGGGLKYKYGMTKYGTKHLLSQLGAYSQAVPELYGLIFACLLAAVVLPLLRGNIINQEPFKYAYATGLTLSSLVAALALFTWVGNLSYGWFPIYVVILPASAYFFAALFGGTTRSRLTLVGCLSLVLLALTPGCAVQAQLQYKMDESAKLLTDGLAAMPHSDANPVRLVMPFTDSGRTEVGERIESLTLNRLIPHYLERRPSQPISFRMFNIIDYCGPQGLHKPTELDHFLKYIDATRSAGYQPTPGMDVFSYWSETGWIHNHHWYQDKLKVGDIIVQPFGDIPPAATFYRGICLFTTNWRDEMRFMPQISVEPVLTVTKQIKRFGQEPLHMGWVALRIKHIDPIAWPISRDGWLMQNSWISCDRTISGRSLHMETRLGFPQSIKVRNGRFVDTVIAGKKSDGVLSFDIPIRAIETDSNPVLVLSSDDPTKGSGDPRHLMLHVDTISVK